jgi:putative transposase
VSKNKNHFFITFTTTVYIMEDFDYKSFQAKALEQLKSGKPLLGKDGAFAPLLENLLNAALEGEMDAHMDDEER